MKKNSKTSRWLFLSGRGGRGTKAGKAKGRRHRGTNGEGGGEGREEGREGYATVFLLFYCLVGHESPRNH